jgi:hypothetical protein
MKTFRTAAAVSAVALVALTSGAAFASTTPAPSTVRPSAAAPTTTPAPSARAERGHRRGHQAAPARTPTAPATAAKPAKK